MNFSAKNQSHGQDRYRYKSYGNNCYKIWFSDRSPPRR